jgi:HlyD family secretion protein
MRRFFSALFVSLLLGATLWSVAFLYRKSEVPPTRFVTALAEQRDIVRKTVAPGALVPRKEVVIKPRVSGVVEKVFVESGSWVKRGAPLARIRVIPNVVRLNEAQAGLRAAEINLQTAKTELARHENLRAQGVLSEAALSQQQLSFELWRQQVVAAESNLELIR